MSDCNKCNKGNKRKEVVDRNVNLGKTQVQVIISYFICQLLVTGICVFEEPLSFIYEGLLPVYALRG